MSVLDSTGGTVRAESEGEDRVYRVRLPTYEMAFYHRDGKVYAIWYNDPAGRLTKLGRQRKLKLYMQRFTTNGAWELRIDDGWMRFFYNDLDRVNVVYGLHKDVVRINAI